MKQTRLIIISVLAFFVIINTSYFWEGKLGFLSFPVFLLLFLIFFVFVAVLIRQISKSITEKFSNKNRLLVMVILTITLAMIGAFPAGVINYEIFKGKVILSAYREGVANCNLALKLRDDRSYTIREVCFGITEESGEYRIKGDTIYFEGGSELRFAVIEQTNTRLKSKAFVRLFRQDVELPLSITLNELNFP